MAIELKFLILYFLCILASRYLMFSIILFCIEKAIEMQYDIITLARIYNSFGFTTQKHFSPQAIPSPTVGDL